jgi:flagellar motor protein MotB
MLTFDPKKKRGQKPESTQLAKPDRPLSRQNRDVAITPHLQQTIGNQAVPRFLKPIYDNLHGNVQPKQNQNVSGDTKNNTLNIQETALSGLNGNAGPLPYLGTIQRSFGRHDVTRVEAHADSAARKANEQLGASAYATGKSVAFRRSPSLHTAAHEAAHIIQQRAGVQLLGGVGQSGERYEQHADAVADKVVEGESAEFLLDRHASGGVTSSAQVQFQNDNSSETYKAAQPGQPLPSGGGPGRGMNNQGSCTLRNGTMQWSMVPMVGYVNVRIEFIPNPALAAASKTISFIQTVSETNTSGGFLGLGSTTSIGSTEVDALPGDRDPFYGAKWNVAGGKWGDEPGSTQVRPGDYEGKGGPREGSRPFTASTGSAVLNDSPMLQVNQTKQFETVATVLETGQTCGSLRWNVQRWRAGFFGGDSSTIVRSVDCTEGASTDFSSVVKRFYGAGGNIILDGFASGSADLPGTHKQLLAPILLKLLANPAKRVIVGGAATQYEADPVVLSRSRAERVRTYLAGEGIGESRIDVEAYGSDWAQSPTAAPGSPQLNRRVQIRIV